MAEGARDSMPGKRRLDVRSVARTDEQRVNHGAKTTVLTAQTGYQQRCMSLWADYPVYLSGRVLKGIMLCAPCQLRFSCLRAF